MNKYRIITDSGSDLPRELLEEYNISRACLTVTVSNEPTCTGEDLDISAFYAKLRDKKTATTSAVSIQAFLELFRSVLESGEDILYLGLSGGLSGTYSAGKVAAEEVRLEFPQRKIVVVDTLCASMGLALITVLCARMKASGASLEEVAAFAEGNKMKVCHWFTVDDLFFLKRGGRVSSATALLGSLLSVKPILHVSNEGKLVSMSKERGRKAALRALLEKMKASAINPEEQTVMISHGDCVADAETLADSIREELHVKEVIISHIGPVIGAHSGPGTIALFFLGEPR